jgi:16S rRNA C967 or C1407 C5-methylase (RsmB/RsmF family)/NOL1/NOP2/fmu family ribosome biogenesis protein
VKESSKGCTEKQSEPIITSVASDVQSKCLLLIFSTCILIVPASILQQLKAINGFDEAAFLAAHNVKPAISVRKHPVKGHDLFAGYNSVPWCMGGVYLPERPVFTLDPAFHSGAYYVQEASSMFLHHIFTQATASRKGLRVLDLCAAPGGKSTLIASELDADSLLISNEVIRTRASILEENITRWGYMNTWVTGNDPRDFGKLEGYFDVIIVDAPCSGSGLWRKDAKAINEWSEGNVQLCAARQQRILADVWPALKTDGILIYATCSFSPQEDEEILDWLGETFAVTGIPATPAKDWQIVETTSENNKLPGYRFFPDKVAGEGFFIAAVRKNDPTETIKAPRFKPEQNRKISDQAGDLIDSGDLTYMNGKDGNYNIISAGMEADAHILQKAVYIRKMGLEAGMPAGKDWIPAHDIALSVHLNKNTPSFEVNKEQALRFLKREDMAIPALEKGWHVVKYNGQGLGWVKGLGNRINNYLPKHWRIRMDIE